MGGSLHRGVSCTVRLGIVVVPVAGEGRRQKWFDFGVCLLCRKLGDVRVRADVPWRRGRGVAVATAPQAERELTCAMLLHRPVTEGRRRLLL